MASRRYSTKYPGVFYREVQRLGGPGTEKVYYIIFKKDGVVYEEKVGRQYVDDMTPARAAGIRAERIEGRRLSRKEIRERLEKQRRLEASKWTIDRLWLEYKKQNRHLKGLFIDENRYKNYLKEPFGSKEPHLISPLEIDQFKSRLIKRGLADATARNVMELLRRLINFAKKRNLCRVPSYLGELPRVSNEKTEDLTPAQLAKLWEVLDNDPNRTAANMMKFVLLTGMRRGELFRLKWSDIDFDHGFIFIRDPKGGRDQKIPLNRAAEEVLMSQGNDSEYVFPGRNGKQRVDINKQVNRIKRAAGLPENFRPLHGLRHVFASMLASSGLVDMYTLQKLLTHKSPMMTQRYAHMRDEALKKASELVEDLIATDTELGGLIGRDLGKVM